MARIKPFANCLTEKMMTYALGRGLEYQDRCVVEKVAERSWRTAAGSRAGLRASSTATPSRSGGVEGRPMT